MLNVILLWQLRYVDSWQLDGVNCRFDLWRSCQGMRGKVSIWRGDRRSRFVCLASTWLSRIQDQVEEGEGESGWDGLTMTGTDLCRKRRSWLWKVCNDTHKTDDGALPLLFVVVIASEPEILCILFLVIQQILAKWPNVSRPSSCSLWLCLNQCYVHHWSRH